MLQDCTPLPGGTILWNILSPDVNKAAQLWQPRNMEGPLNHLFLKRRSMLISQIICALLHFLQKTKPVTVVQAEPFFHNKQYMQLLGNQDMLSSVQVMSRVYLAETTDERVKTPLEAIDATSKHPWFRPERFSLR